MTAVARNALAVAVVAAAVVAGVWLAGGVVTDDFRAAMALTGAWFALSAGACLAVARRFRTIRIAVVATYLLTAGVVGGYLALTTLRDRVVHERVVAAAPAPAVQRERGTAERVRGPVELARGRFRSHEHATSGRAAIVRLRDGRRFLTLTSFATAAGPDLRVRLTPGGSIDGGARGAVDLGALKGNRGDQQYAVPAGARVRGRTVLIWCRAFSAPFGSARLDSGAT